MRLSKKTKRQLFLNKHGGKTCQIAIGLFAVGDEQHLVGNMVANVFLRAGYPVAALQCGRIDGT